MKQITLIFCLFFSLSIFSQNRKSFFYEISGKGIEKSYLYGTMHLPNYKALQIPDTLFKLCENLDGYVFEILLDEKTIKEIKVEKSKLRKSNRFKDKATPSQYNTVKKVFEESLDIELEKFDTLSANELSHFFLKEFVTTTEGPDQVIYKFAKQQNKELIALETPDVINKIQFKYDEYNLELECKKYAISKAAFSGMLDSYYKGNFARFYQMKQKTKKIHPKFYKSITTDRNKIFNDRVLELLKQKKSILVTVGLGHFVDKDGMIAVLKSKGYKVKRISGPSEVGKKAQLSDKFVKAFRDKKLMSNFSNTLKDAALYLRLQGEEKQDSLIFITSNKIKNNSKDEFAFAYRAGANRAKGNYKKAIADINSAYAIKQRAKYLHTKADIYYEQEKYKLAITEYGKLPNDWKETNKETLSWNLGQCYFQLGMYQKSLEQFTIYNSVSKDETASNYSAYCMIQLNRFQAGLDLLNTTKTEALKDHSYYAFKAIAYKNLDLPDKQLIAYQKANKLSQGLYDYEIAICYYEKSDYGNAELQFQKVIKKNNNELNLSKYYRGISLFMLDRKLESKNELLTYFKVHPEDSDLNYYLSRIFYGEQNYTKALFHINKSLITVKDFGNYYLKGQVLHELARHQEALTVFKNALKLNPKHGDTLYYIGYCYIEQNNKKVGCQYYLKAKLNGSADMDPVINDNCK